MNVYELTPEGGFQTIVKLELNTLETESPVGLRGAVVNLREPFVGPT